jgi:poly-beta-hydroxybutyrate-responsive repressor
VTGRRHLPRGARSRRSAGPGRWHVRARLERFTEPAVLLVLRDSPGHGYELLMELQTLMPNERIDMGNLYRILRSLEREGLVTSAWDEEAPGPAKRVYVITQSGLRVLAQWVDAFKKVEQQIAAFSKRYAEGRG